MKVIDKKELREQISAMEHRIEAMQENLHQDAQTMSHQRAVAVKKDYTLSMQRLARLRKKL